MSVPCFVLGACSRRSLRRSCRPGCPRLVGRLVGTLLVGLAYDGCNGRQALWMCSWVDGSRRRDVEQVGFFALCFRIRIRTHARMLTVRPGVSELRGWVRTCVRLCVRVRVYVVCLRTPHLTLLRACVLQECSAAGSCSTHMALGVASW